MGLLDLFIAASIPILKVLLITALGSYLALDHVNVLSEDARKHINNVSSSFHLLCVILFYKCSDFDRFIGVLYYNMNVSRSYFMSSTQRLCTPALLELSHMKAWSSCE